MKAKELLSLLTPRVQRFHLAPGGIPNLTAEDISHALGMIQSDVARLYARVKYAGQTEFAEGLVYAIRRDILIRKVDNDWRIPRKDFLLDMSYMVLAEAVDPNTCRWCFGRSEVRPESGPVIVCSACEGQGRRKIRDLDRAKLMELSKQAWANQWGPRYKEIQEETVDFWEDLFAGAIKKRLKA